MASALLGLLVAAAAAQPLAPSTAAAAAAPLRLLAPQEYPDFAETYASRKGLALAAKRSIKYLESGTGPKVVRLGGREYGAAVLADTARELLVVLGSAASAGELASLVRERFDVFQSAGSDGAGKVLFSSYYQPVLDASPKRAGEFRHPLYRRPPDMVEAALGEFDKKYGEDLLIGRVEAGISSQQGLGGGKIKRFVPYFTRGDIDLSKALAGQGLEIAWLKSRFDALDLHIQGSGILRFPDGREVLARYAGNNGRPFQSVGLLLVKAGVFTKEDITREKMRDYLRGHPDAEGWIISQNPRFIFYELQPLPEGGEPYGTVQEPLVASRSIAVDPAAVPLGALAFFSVVSPQADEKGRLLGHFPTRRFAFCMDTGGAIKGPGRVDIYVGHGPQAAGMAPHQWHEGQLYVLVKKLPPRDR